MRRKEAQPDAGLPTNNYSNRGGHFKKKGGHPENPIQRARVKAGLTQVEAVEFFPFELRTLQAYEAGDSSPVLEDARIMAKVYHCRIDELVGDETT